MEKLGFTGERVKDAVLKLMSGRLKAPRDFDMQAGNLMVHFKAISGSLSHGFRVQFDASLFFKILLHSGCTVVY